MCNTSTVTVRRSLPIACAALLLLGLPACKPSSTRPVAVPLPPPEVHCAPAPGQSPKPVPDCTRITSWLCVPLMDDYVLHLQGIIEAEATKAFASRKCESDLRAKGVIR